MKWFIFARSKNIVHTSDLGAHDIIDTYTASNSFLTIRTFLGVPDSSRTNCTEQFIEVNTPSGQFTREKRFGENNTLLSVNSNQYPHATFSSKELAGTPQKQCQQLQHFLLAQGFFDPKVTMLLCSEDVESTLEKTGYNIKRG